MIKRHWLLAMLGVALLIATSAYTVLARQEAKPIAQEAFTYYSYAVTFVCGIQRFSPNNPGEPPVKPGPDGRYPTAMQGNAELDKWKI